MNIIVAKNIKRLREEKKLSMDELVKLGLSATVRRSLGRDIDGACGQLRAKRMAGK